MLSELVMSNLKASAAPFGDNGLCGLIGGVSIKVGYDDLPAVGGCEPGQALADSTPAPVINIIRSCMAIIFLLRFTQAVSLLVLRTQVAAQRLVRRCARQALDNDNIVNLKQRV